MTDIKDIQDKLELIRNDPYLFGVWSGFDDLSDLHNGWIKSFLFRTDDMTLMAHRGSYKTTCLSIAIALMIIIYPNKNIMFFRKTDDDVKEIITQVRNLLENDYYQRIAYELYGTELILTRATAFEIDTNLKDAVRGTSQLVGLGIKASKTGKHADIIITDDIITIVDRISRAEREYIKLQYQELQNIKNRGGRIINCGTPWHRDDAFQLMPNPEKYSVYDTGMISDAEQQHLRNTLSSSLYSANYELKHIADEDALFTNPTIDDGTNTTKIYGGVCHIDASYGGTDGTAFTVLKQQPDGTIYVYGELKQQHVDECLAGFEGRRRLYRAGTMYTEKNADKGYLHKRIMAPKKNYHESMNKYVKISTHLKGKWDKIIFIKETDPEYISQIMDYTENASHDDAPDSLASLIRETIEKSNRPQTMAKSMLGI